MSRVGETVTCAETGKTFVIKADGCSFNYATDYEGRIFSDEGVDIRERRDLLDRSKPFFCYLHNNSTVTGWKGNVLGYVKWSTQARVGFGRTLMTYVRVQDVHGGRWHGKGQGVGMCITLFPSKEKIHD